MTAAQFAAHAEMYPVVSTQAAEFHEMFVNGRVTSAASDATSETGNAFAV